ncbi:MAG: hypothetical protein QOH81_3089 [Sphingomonadales bacterium]|jgi:hypothetical protein|nr:hypothetical protein [Sphingomonadales bacterium]
MAERDVQGRERQQGDQWDRQDRPRQQTRQFEQQDRGQQGGPWAPDVMSSDQI